MRSHSPFFFLVIWGIASAIPQTSIAAPQPVTGAQAQAVLDQALANELRAAQDSGHPMRYLLRKSTPRLTSTREIFETKDGDVARLLTVNGQPLTAVDAQKEQARLDELKGDPGRQKHRKQAEDADMARALKVLRALPAAFLYQYAGPAGGDSGVARFTFRPNPSFSPPDLETQVLTEMSGELWIDTAHRRVTRLEGHLDRDVDFGWGILGRLNKGGWIRIEQAEVTQGIWRTVRFQMAMSGRVVIKTRSFDTVEEQSGFAPLPLEMGYREAIDELGRE